MSERERMSHFRFLYLEHTGDKTQQDLHLVKVSDGNYSDGRKVRKRVFLKRRFPRLSSVATEMSIIREWVSTALECNLLKVRTLGDAYEVFRREFNRYRAVGCSRYYLGYPPNRERGTNNASGGTTEVASHLAVNNRVEDGFVRVESRRSPTTTSAQLVRRHGPLCQGCHEIVSVHNHPVLSSQAHVDPIPQSVYQYDAAIEAACSEDDHNLNAEMGHLFDTARNDRLFFLLCNAVDKTGGSKLHIIGHNLLSKCKDNLLNIDAQLRDTIQYAVEKHFGSKQRESFLELEGRVQGNVCSLKLARACLGLVSYEEMEWNEIMRSNVTANESPAIARMQQPEVVNSPVRSQSLAPVSNRRHAAADACSRPDVLNVNSEEMMEDEILDLDPAPTTLAIPTQNQSQAISPNGVDAQDHGGDSNVWCGRREYSNQLNRSQIGNPSEVPERPCSINEHQTSTRTRPTMTNIQDQDGGRYGSDVASNSLQLPPNNETSGRDRVQSMTSRETSNYTALRENGNVETRRSKQYRRQRVLNGAVKCRKTSKQRIVNRRKISSSFRSVHGRKDRDVSQEGNDNEEDMSYSRTDYHGSERSPDNSNAVVDDHCPFKKVTQGPLSVCDIISRNYKPMYGLGRSEIHATDDGPLSRNDFWGYDESTLLRSVVGFQGGSSNPYVRQGVLRSLADVLEPCEVLPSLPEGSFPTSSVGVETQLRYKCSRREEGSATLPPLGDSSWEVCGALDIHEIFRTTYNHDE